MAQKNRSHAPVSDDQEGWQAAQEQPSVGIYDLSQEESLPSLIDLIPRRGQPLGMLLTGTAAIALLVAGYRGFGANTPAWISSPLAAFALEGPGNLASWYSSLVLTATAIYALIVWWTLHWLYQQKSGVWLAAAMCWFFMGMDESAGLHMAFGQLLGTFTGNPQTGALWWLIPYGIIFAGIVSRLVIDLRHSWGALFWMGMAITAYLWSVLVQVGLDIAPLLGIEPVMAEEIGEMAGHWFLLMYNASFAAYLVRDIVMDRPTDELCERPEQTSLDPSVSQTSMSQRDRQIKRVSPTHDEPSGEQGDILIIHPPHGYGSPRVVRRIVRPRKQTSSTSRTSRKRSDLDVPARATTRKTSSSLGANNTSPLSTPVTSSPSNLDGQTISSTSNAHPPAMNAFLAGMAYAETQKVAQPTTGLAVSPRSVSEGPLGGTPDDASWHAPFGVSHGHEGQPGPTPSIAGGSGFAYQSSLASGTTLRQTAVGLPASSSSQGQGMMNGSIPGSIQNTAALSANTPPGNPTSPAQAPVQLPARKLTKEEKKRLKQLYKQRMAQQTG